MQNHYFKILNYIHILRNTIQVFDSDTGDEAPTYIIGDTSSITDELGNIVCEVTDIT